MSVSTQNVLPLSGCIRQATAADAVRLAEIEIFNYRLNFYPIFKNDSYYFDELQTNTLAQTYRDEPQLLDHTFVYDDGVVKGFCRTDGARLCKLFVEPVLQGGGIGGQLLEYAVQNLGADYLWALEKNRRAICFYQRHGFALTGEKQPEEGTTELLVRLARPKEG